MNAAVSLLFASIVAAAPVDVAVVCPEFFQSSLAPWIEHRRAQGHEIAILSAQGTSTEIRGRIRACAKNGQLKYLLLVGDAPELNDMADAPRLAARRVAATINVRFGSEPTIASDDWYADLDDDRLPDMAVGRLTCDTREELSRSIRKIIRYETNQDFGEWRRCIRFVTGVGGFNPLTDALIESTARQLIVQGLPPAYSCQLASANWRSPYCPAPPRFAETIHRGLNQGSLFWIYMGHGHRQSLDAIGVPGQRHPILDVAQIKHLQCGNGNPIAILLACYVGAFDGAQDALAEELLRAEEGPIAVLAGSRVTMPYGMAVLASALADEYVLAAPATVGELLLNAKRKTASPEAGGARRAVLNFLARVASPNSDELAEERMEHIAMFNLLGDPLVRLRYPLSVQVDKPGTVEAGDVLAIRGHSPLAGRASIELVAPRGQLRQAMPHRTKYAEDGKSLEQMDRDYLAANDLRFATASLDVAMGNFSARLKVPSGVSGLCDVRIFVQGPDAFALGSTSVSVNRPLPAGSWEPTSE